MTDLRSALWLPIFDELADPAVVMRLSAEAEQAGWHGVFVWDHLCWREPLRDVADPWITLAAIACATERVRIGPMVTALARRRPAKVAKETATLDGLSAGRLTLGVGLGSDRFGREFSMSGEPVDDRERAARCDGYFPVNLEHPDQLAEAAATIAGLRADAGAAAPYDIAVELPPDTDPRPFAAAGATWWLTAFTPDAVTVDMVRGVIRNGPA